MLMTHQTKRIVVGLGAKGADARELDELTRSLADELRQIEVRSVDRISEGEAPPGSKGDPFTIGWLAVTLTPILAKKVFDVLADWVNRVQGRTIKITLGQNTIELSDASPKEREKLLKRWLKEVDLGRSA
jgi:hypothetical protein